MHLHRDTPSETGTAEISGYDGRFTGEVRLEMLDEAADESGPDIARVSFGDSAVTYWHSHPGGQRLLVLSGRARVGTDEGEMVLDQGDFVVTPPGERHYHGAVDGHACRMLAITWGTTDWASTPPPSTSTHPPTQPPVATDTVEDSR